MKKNVFGLRGVAFFAALVLLLAGFSVPAFADYWVTYSGTGAKGPIRIGQDVEWSTGDTKVVSEEVIGWYNENSGVFTVTEVTATGAEVNKIDGLTATAAELNLAADINMTIEEVAAANIITSAECGRTFVLNSATEFASTLPTVTGNGGCKFRFIVRGAPSEASYTIVAAAETTNIIGGVNELEVDTADDGPSCVAATGCDVITFVDGVSVAGDFVELIADGTNWYLSGQTAADGGATVADTP